MLKSKEQFITIEDFFSSIVPSHPSYAYPNVAYGNLDGILFYKPKYDESSANTPVSLYVQLDSDDTTKMNTLLQMIQNYLKDYSVCSYEVGCGEELNPKDIFISMLDYSAATYPERYRKECNDFMQRFSAWIRESKETWFAKLKIYDNFDYSEFLLNPDKIITKEDISTPRVAKSYSRTRKVNDTPEEIGDFTGDGYVNQIEQESYNDIAPTGTDTTESTSTDHDVERNLRILNECLNQVRNIYRSWLLDFRRKVLVD